MSSAITQDSSSSTIPPAAAADAQQTPSAPSGGVSGSTKVNSLNDLKEKAPEVYNQMLLSMATTVCQDSKKQQDHIKEIMAEARRNDSRGG
jgi:hypothetical protein